MMNIPHKVILMESSDGSETLACIADRENGRIQCFSTPYGNFMFQIYNEAFNGRVFAISYSEKDKLLYAVAGPSLFDTSREVYAFAFDAKTQKLVTVFAPDSGVCFLYICFSYFYDVLMLFLEFFQTFKQPHDMAVSKNGDYVYVVEIGPNNIWMFKRGLFYNFL